MQNLNFTIDPENHTQATHAILMYTNIPFCFINKIYKYAYLNSIIRCGIHTSRNTSLAARLYNFAAFLSFLAKHLYTSIQINILEVKY